MRQIILDTETTGLSWEKGNRLVEIGCVELVGRRPTGRTFQRYINPEREMEPGAAEVTGLTLEFLADKPRFAEVADDFLAFIAGAELVIHNAEFDVGFINYELRLLGDAYGSLERHAGVLDTLKLARELYPGQRNSLDALCKRLGVDNKHRQLHGALLDAELLAEVYLGMTSGQGDLGLLAAGEPESADGKSGLDLAAVAAIARVVLRADADELAAHEARLRKIAGKAGKSLWPLPGPAA